MTIPDMRSTVAVINTEKGSVLVTGGLTIREHFAALAMQGLLSSMQPRNGINAPAVAKEAVECADALIQMLNFKS